MRPTPRAPQALGLLLTLATAGCCDLAAFFCGPDRSEWVPISYATHRDALVTFLEAVRRDHVRVICQSLSREFKQRLGIPGCFEAAIAWDRVLEQAPAAHLLGRAEVTEPEVLSPAPPAAGPPRRVRYVLEIGGHRVAVDLERRAYAGLRYRAGDDEEPLDDAVPSLEPMISLVPQAHGTSVVTLAIPDLAVPPGVSPADIVAVEGGHEWKVADLRELE